MTDWAVICTLRDAQGIVSHIGVDVPRGTQHVPVAEALTAMTAGRHRFFIADDGDRLLLREVPEMKPGLATRWDQEGRPLLDQLPDCGLGIRYGETDA